MTELFLNHIKSCRLRNYPTAGTWAWGTKFGGLNVRPFTTQKSRIGWATVDILLIAILRSAHNVPRLDHN